MRTGALNSAECVDDTVSSTAVTNTATRLVTRSMSKLDSDYPTMGIGQRMSNSRGAEVVANTRTTARATNRTNNTDTPPQENAPVPFLSFDDVIARCTPQINLKEYRRDNLMGMRENFVKNCKCMCKKYIQWKEAVRRGDAQQQQQQQCDDKFIFCTSEDMCVQRNSNKTQFVAPVAVYVAYCVLVDNNWQVKRDLDESITVLFNYNKYARDICQDADSVFSAAHFT